MMIAPFIYKNSCSLSTQVAKTTCSSNLCFPYPKWVLTKTYFQQTCRMAIIFDLLRNLLIWAMTFVGEDVNQFGMIVGILCYATPQAYNY
jgi:hypothetical protein